MQNGYIKMYRKIVDATVWQDLDLLRLWMFCLMKASYKQREVLIGKQKVFLYPGQFITGRSSLHKEYYKGFLGKQANETTLWNWLKKLREWGHIDIKSSNKFSVVTIVHWHEHQGTLTTELQQIDNELPADQQQIDINKNNKHVKNDKNANKKDGQNQAFDESSTFYKLANRLFQKILEHNPNHKKPNLQIWANHVRLMIERDNRSEEQIKYVIDWCQKDSFWHANVLSTAKLREKFDTLVIQSNAERGETPQHTERPKYLKGVLRYEESDRTDSQGGRHVRLFKQS